MSEPKGGTDGTNALDLGGGEAGNPADDRAAFVRNVTGELPASTGGAVARTPDELETLLEDALITGDREVLTELFEATAVLVPLNGRSVRGRDEVIRKALATWQDDHTYVAQPQHITQARDVALIVTKHGINVARRDRDAVWRYTIVLESVEDSSKGAIA